ncbi:5'-methylthioadenosine/adenosylhomocysteine nucleosidase [Ammoniphilus sp. YIM 78166]|uniref:5'-methylthioadenosine/adenosylhomocysteine nucleosidase n=1 Tax=Ammoniphilus sp. YIM 78166 TaxID=1644106 RepID=UPI0010700EBD|nr:5'-methylthioadenosine/adenosylhomocysteine nucleosidase [Ammoniphilus sp. YIM 78166]
MIGIIGAMDEEIQLYKEVMENVSETTKAGITYYTGILHQKEVVLCKSGVGKVNASICTQILIDRFGVQSVVFTGVAGALNPRLEIGDIVVSTDCQYHDMDVTPLGFKRGEIPFSEKSIFRADDGLVQLALEAGKGVIEGNIITGRILSGDQFVASRDLVKQLHEELHGDCTEMEGAAVAHVCDLNDVPFVIVRAMSDKADGSAHINFPEFTVLASKRSYEMVSRMLPNI